MTFFFFSTLRAHFNVSQSLDSETVSDFTLQPLQKQQHSRTCSCRSGFSPTSGKTSFFPALLLKNSLAITFRIFAPLKTSVSDNPLPLHCGLAIWWPSTWWWCGKKKEAALTVDAGWNGTLFTVSWCRVGNKWTGAQCSEILFPLQLQRELNEIIYFLIVPVAFQALW